MGNNIRVGKYYYSNNLFSVGEISKIKARIPESWVEIYSAQNGDYRKISHVSDTAFC